MANSHHETGKRLSNAVLRIASLLIMFFLVAPIIIVFLLSFGKGHFMSIPMQGITFGWYKEFFSSGRWLTAMCNSLLIACASTIVAVILGTMASLGLTNRKLPFRVFIETIFLAPMIMPAVIIGVGIYFVFSEVKLTSTWSGLILAHATLSVPFVIVNIKSSLTGLNRNVLWAAESMGAKSLTIFYRVIIPVITPGILSGGVFSFATSLDEVVVTLLLSGPGQRTMPIEMFTAARESLSPILLAAASVLTLVTLGILSVIFYAKTRMSGTSGQPSSSP